MKARTITAALALAVLVTPAFAQDFVAPDSPIVVTGPRLSQDEIINQQVVDALAGDARLSGRIGVQTTDQDVELSGIVTNASQSRHAERIAMGVPGVRHVHNTLATRMGTSTN